MKSYKTLFAAVLLGSAAQAQVVDTVSIGAAYSQQVYYSMTDGIKKSTAKNDWDLAFETTNQGYSIWINASTGTEAYLYPGDTSDWATLDTAGMASWTHRTNSDTSWSYGALSQDQNGFDIGWGTYNMITHAVVGDRLFVVKLSNGSWQKVWIKGLIGGIYTFRHATLAPGMDMQHTLNKATFAGKNFGYYSLQNHNHLDKEPSAEDWDLFFGQYTTYIPQPYLVTGVLQSMGTLASKAYPVNDSSTYVDFGNHPFQKEINIIGYDWKPYNMSTMMYEIEDSTVYFVKTNAGGVWKMVFLHFGGSADGNMVFSKQELVGAGVDDNGQNRSDFSLFPNPASETVKIVHNFTENSSLNIYSLSGQLMKSESLKGNGIHQDVQISDLQSGLYLVQIQTGNDILTKKLMVR